MFCRHFGSQGEAFAYRIAPTIAPAWEFPQNTGSAARTVCRGVRRLDSPQASDHTANWFPMSDQIIIDTGSSSSAKYRARRKRQQGTWLVWFGVTALLLAVVGGVIYFQLIGSRELMISAIDPLRVSEQQQIGFKIPVAANAIPADTLRFSLRGAPPGASVDPFTGYFQWEPNEAQGPGKYELVLHVEAQGYGIQAQRPVHIHVLEHNTLPKLEPIANLKVRVGENASIQLLAHDDDIPAQSLRYE